MEIKITAEEVIMLEAFRQMRKAHKSKAPNKAKEKAVNDIFWRANKAIDVCTGEGN